MFRRVAGLVLISVSLAVPGWALSYDENGGWRGVTSLQPAPTSRGDAVKLSWSVTPDGTIDSYTRFQSNLQSEFTRRFGENYMDMFRTIFDRVSAVSGLQFTETSDDGSPADETGRGAMGVRGDLRINGVDLDSYGAVGWGGWSSMPYANPSVITTLNTAITWPTYNDWTKIAMHEVGHGMGFGHQRIYDSPTATSEFNGASGSITAFMNINGPQFDDLYMMHRMYGDILERDGGNDSRDRATDMGDVTGSSKAYGTQIDDLIIAPDETDFTSIDGTSDIDFFRFHLDGPSELALRLMEKGPSYYFDHVDNDRHFFEAGKQSDLFMDLYDGLGGLIAHVNAAGLGETESLTRVLSAGDYFVSIAGLQDANQFYRLDVVATPVPEPSGLLALLGGVAVLGRRAWRRL